MIRRLRLLKIALLSAALVQSVFCTTTETKARELAKAAVRTALGRGPRLFLVVTRNPMLEAKFRLCLPESSRTIPFIYRVSNEGDETAGRSSIQHVSVEGPLMFLVAVTGNGTVFLIRGASDSRKQVEQLTKQEGIRLTDVGLARSYAEFYLEVNPDNLSMNYVGSPDQLKFNAKEEFHIVLGEREWRKAFNEWWNDYALKYTKQDFNMQVKKNGPVFSVTFSVLSSFGSKPPKAPPRVLRALLILSSHGDVQGPRFRPAALPRH